MQIEGSIGWRSLGVEGKSEKMKMKVRKGYVQWSEGKQLKVVQLTGDAVLGQCGQVRGMQ